MLGAIPNVYEVIKTWNLKLLNLNHSEVISDAEKDDTSDVKIEESSDEEKPVENTMNNDIKSKFLFMKPYQGKCD